MEGPFSGFGYPLNERIVFPSSEAFFSSQRSWASLFRAFLLFDDLWSSFPLLYPLRRFLSKPPSLEPALQRLTPIEKAVPLIAP
jgi:hypothetical protein